MNRKQRRAARSQSVVPLRAVASTAAQLAAEALRHHRAGRVAEAGELYRRALVLDPSHAGCLQNLGAIALAAGRRDEAQAAFERAIAFDPTLVVAHVNLGHLHRSQGRLDQAIDCYLRAIELQPDQLDAHNGLCTALLALGKFEAVIAHYEQILALKPDYLVGHQNLAIAQLGAGDTAHALASVLRMLAIAETPEAKLLFVQCLQSLPAASADESLRDLLARAMSEPWGRPGDLVRHALGLIRADGDIPRDPLLRCLLENARNEDIAMEHWLAAARLALLDAAQAAAPDDAVDDGTLAFHCALARQCFINEYVLTATEAETARVGALRARLAAALAANAPLPALWLVAVAAYGPLHALDEDDRLVGHVWPAPVDAMLTQQLREPAEERRLRGTIPALTPIEDAVSVLVQSQYEENPYPRWVKAAPASAPVALDSHIRRLFPLSKFRNLDRVGAVDVLVAGCGSGQQLVDVAQRIADARVLAVDLSRTSLTYAKRQTDALQLANIEYGQADVLKLGTLGRSFDVIDCGGVLHHLADPVAGWRALLALLALLRPDGLMRIALYSELARPHIVAARAFLAQRGYTCDAAGIRTFRQDVMALPDSDPVKLVSQSPDFYSVSGCRDLVFHVQEHRFTLPEIANLLDAIDLAFLGFEIQPNVLHRYAQRFPGDRTRTDLACWHAFEQSNRGTFSGMYQFWAQRRG